MGEPRDRAEGTAPTVAVAADLGSSATLAAGSPEVPGTPGAAGDLGERYVLGETLGRGGMGEVRLARDERVGRDVAVKQMRAATPGAEAIARFLREARVQGRLDHPAIVPVHDLGVDEHGLPYFAMKRLAGVTLASILDRHARGDAEALARWPRRLLLARLAEVCLAVHFAHTRGVIHRDLKPHNVMLGDFGEVYVLDWASRRSRMTRSSAARPASSAPTSTPSTASPAAPRRARCSARPATCRPSRSAAA